MIRGAIVTALLFLASSCDALTINANKPSYWSAEQRADPQETIKLTIGLKQSNADRLFDQLIDVSDPTSSNYGKHWSQEQVSEYVRPEASTRSAVFNWLNDNGIDGSMIDETLGGEWLSVNLSVDQAESLLHTKYHLYTHQETGHQVVRSLSYSVPDAIAQFIDVIGPTTRFPHMTPAMKPSKKHARREAIKKSHKHIRTIAGASAGPCDQGSSPDCLRSMYQMGDAAATSNKSSVAVTGFLEQYISLTDLATFYKQFDTSSTGRTPAIVGPNDQTNPGDEASLDIQYVSSMAHGSAFSFIYTAGRAPKNPDNEPFLVFVQSLANYTSVPWVISTSYGDDENTVDADYAKRLSQEFSKLGLRGVSVLFSSGDSGVGCNANGDKFMPTLPSTLPSVTSVGATGYDGKTESAAGFSSGGFSNLFAMPSYQTAAVNNYLKTYAGSLPPSSYYNTTGTRAAPDVSANGEDFPIVLSGETTAVDGTSCSSPTFAGILATLNDIRLKAGKAPLGFINPLIYQHPEIFNDITQGNNGACNTNGFPAEKGWDPVTGLGTPNYVAMAKLIGSL